MNKRFGQLQVSSRKVINLHNTGEIKKCQAINVIDCCFLRFLGITQQKCSGQDTKSKSGTAKAVKGEHFEMAGQSLVSLAIGQLDISKGGDTKTWQTNFDGGKQRSTEIRRLVNDKFRGRKSSQLIDDFSTYGIV